MSLYRKKFAIHISHYLWYFRVYLGVRTCELFLCFVAIVRVRAIMLTSLFSLFYVTGEFHKFLHRGRAIFSLSKCGLEITYIVRQWNSSIVLSVSVYLNIIKQTETRIQMIKWSIVRPNPMQICACACPWIYRWTKNCGKSGLGLRAAGPSQAAGPSRACF